MLRSALFAIAATAIAAPAFAGTTYTATLETPVAERERFVANKAIWICEGDTCVAELRTSQVKTKYCKQVSEEIGALTSFKTDKAELSSDNLASCNAVAKPREMPAAEFVEGTATTN